MRCGIDAFLAQHRHIQKLLFPALLLAFFPASKGTTSTSSTVLYFCLGGVNAGSSCYGLTDLTSCGIDGVCVSSRYKDVCGNGFRLQNEQCDDGNTINGDGCSSNCTVEVGWQCVGGSSTSADVCTVLCGDGIRLFSGCCQTSGCSQECFPGGCDDGNTIDGDGCSSDCSTETGYTCWGGNIDTMSTCLCTRTRVSAGTDHTCAISSASRLECWGNSENNKTLTNFFGVTAPILWPKGSWTAQDVWVSVGVGNQHNCAIGYNGNMICWGWQGPTALGDGRLQMPSPPDWERLSQGGFKWAQVGVGSGFSCALLNEDRYLYAPVCGPGQQPGTGCNLQYLCGGQCRAVNDWSTKWLERHPCFYSYVTQCDVPSNRTIVCWGSNFYKEIEMPVFDYWTDVAVGQTHACGIFHNGSAVCWGNNDVGQATVPAISRTWIQLAAGGSHTCGIDSDRYLYCWGRGHEGQTKIPCSNSWLRVSAGWVHTCGIHSDLSMDCWGSNNYGQLNVPHQPGTCVDAAGKSTGVPCKSSADCATGLCSGPRKYDWVQVSAGRQNTCAVDKSNAVYCWGSNSFGQTFAPGSQLHQTGVGSHNQPIYLSEGFLTAQCS